IDKKVIYRYGYDNDSNSLLLLGNAGCLVHLKAEYGGQEITVKFKSPSGKFLQADGFSLGTESDVLGTIICENCGLIAYLIFSLFIIIIAFVAYFYCKWKCQLSMYSLFFDIGIFVLLTSIWLYTDSVLPQFIFTNSYLIILISFYAFMLLAIPFLSIVSYSCGTTHTGVLILQILLLINVAVQSLLFLLGYADFRQMLPVTHGIIVIVFLYLSVKLIRGSFHNDPEYARGVMLAEGILMLMSIIAMFRYYMNSQSNYAHFFRYGMVGFVLILILLSIKKSWENLQEYTKIQVYKSMAYLDSLTQLGSRAAFEIRMRSIADEMLSYSRLTIIVGDMNNLKEVNDTHGHDVGDKQIRAIASCIMETCRKIGDCYRIGGDEFALIIPNTKINAEEYRSKLQQSIDCYNNGNPGIEPVSIAIGYAAMDIPFPNGFTLNDLFHQADQDMYRKKRKMKNI
ncbi:MAG: GGDEF domain-containing protein, partial [Oscillospiraceae bacterium]